MKVLFVGVGLTHYFNQVLNTLNDQPTVEIVNLVAADRMGNVPPSVHQTDTNIRFSVIALSERIVHKYSDRSHRSFRGLASALARLRPDIIVTSEAYAMAFLRDPNVHRVVHNYSIRLILKDIPFRLVPYNERRMRIESGSADWEYIPFFQAYLVNLFRIVHLPRLGTMVTNAIAPYRRRVARTVLLRRLEERKHIFQSVDAHVDYVDAAYDLFSGYGVSRDAIFITRNSPDTDILFAAREKITYEPPILPPHPHRLIHVGRLIPWKRVDLLIGALAEIRTAFPDAELLIIGTGPQEQELKQLARTTVPESAIRFLGGVYDPELLGKYLTSSSVYVLAGMGGISLNDAMAFGRPVICSVCDGTEQKLVRDHDNGLYFKEGDQGDLAQKIATLFQDPELAQRMGERSTEIIRNEVNIHTVIAEYLRAFAYVLSRDPAPSVPAQPR